MLIRLASVSFCRIPEESTGGEGISSEATSLLKLHISHNFTVFITFLSSFKIFLIYHTMLGPSYNPPNSWFHKHEFWKQHENLEFLSRDSKTRVLKSSYNAKFQFISTERKTSSFLFLNFTNLFCEVQKFKTWDLPKLSFENSRFWIIWWKH